MRVTLRKALVSSAYRYIASGLKPPIMACATIVQIARLVECLRDLGINCVLDVGANEGQFASRLRRLGFKGWIISFEPHPIAFERLSKNLGKDKRWRGYPFALGSRYETRTFYLQADSSFSSFLRPIKEALTPASVAEIEVRPLSPILDGLIADIESPRIMLKLDTQGWDLQVLRGASIVLPRVDALLSELSIQPLYEEMTPFDVALGIYRDLGFALYDITPINHRLDGTVVECDCLMVRASRHM
jgi:FkbM family methyltransferase